MEATVYYLLMLQKYIISKQKTLKEKIIHYVLEVTILQLIIRKTGLKGN